MRFFLSCLLISALCFGSGRARVEIISALQDKIPLSYNPSNQNTLLFFKAPQALNFKDLIAKKPIFNQNIANYINQIYYSTKINFDFSRHFYIQSGKVFRQINIQRSSKRDEGERVRLIFVGFEY